METKTGNIENKTGNFVELTPFEKESINGGDSIAKISDIFAKSSASTIASKSSSSIVTSVVTSVYTPLKVVVKYTKLKTSLR